MQKQEGKSDIRIGSLVANLYERSGFIGEGCESSVSTDSGTLFQLKLNAGGSNGYAKSFSIEVADSGTGEVPVYSLRVAIAARRTFTRSGADISECACDAW